MRNFITIINLAILFGITSILSRFDQSQEKNTNENGPKGEAGAVVSSEQNDFTTVQSNFTLWPTQWSGDEKINEKNEKANDELISFLNEMADSRLVERAQGMLASQRATKRPLKDYGARMARDQSAMLADLTTLATQKNIFLAKDFKDDKAAALNAFKNVHGVSFDRRFISMKIKDYKRAVKKLERSTRSTNADIQVYATKYLPVVQSHLDQIKALKKSL
jgi:predicted outer membrane protein